MISMKTGAPVLMMALLGWTMLQAAPMELKIINAWSGSVDDEALQKQMPEGGFITDAKVFAKLVKSWGVAEKVPEVNFEKEIILVATTQGSRLNLKPSIDQGDIKALGFGTRDLRPGFRYVMVSVPREGVDSVNGKKLPK